MRVVRRCDSGTSMKLGRVVLDELMIRPGEPAGLDARSTESTTADWKGASKKHYKKVAEEDLGSFVGELVEAQQRFWANGSHALLVVLQAMDAAGKDGTIRHVMSGVNPQGCKVEGFRQPSRQDFDHDFLWSAARVHPELLGRGRPVPGSLVPAQVWQDRYEDINAFEHHLERSGTRIVKLFLHVSKEEQKQRFLKRLDDPDKNWKFSPSDLAERQHWDDYRTAYEDALTATSTDWAPWFVVPADHKYALRALVGGIIVDAIDALDLKPPALTPAERGALTRARSELLAE